MDSLNKDSTDQHIQDAISDEIKMCMDEGKGDQKQCAGRAYGIAREKTGKDLNYGE
jgi:hypothetical protein